MTWVDGRIAAWKPGRVPRELLALGDLLGALVVGECNEVYLADGGVIQDE